MWEQESTNCKVLKRTVQPVRHAWHLASHLVYFVKRGSAARCAIRYTTKGVRRILLDSHWKYRIQQSGQFLGVSRREDTENIMT